MQRAQKFEVWNIGKLFYVLKRQEKVVFPSARNETGFVFAKLHKWRRNDISPSLNIWVNLFLCNGDYKSKFNIVFAVTATREPSLATKDGSPWYDFRGF